MVTASGLLDRTPLAPLPADDTVGEIASFGLRQTGQLDKANADKAGAVRLGETCEKYQQQAIERAKQRNRLWRKVF